MPEVKDVAVVAAGAVQNPRGAIANLIERTEQRYRIEIALHPDVVADALPAGGQVDAPIEPDHVATGLAHQLQQAGCGGPEVDHGYAGRDAGNDVARVRQHKAPVVIRRKTAHPAVEELHGLRPGGDLRVEVAD